MTQHVELADHGEHMISDLQALATMVDDSAPGWSRVALSELDVTGRHWVLRQMIEAGLDARIDEAGNVLGLLKGDRPGAGTIMTGSHTDTVPGGGRFDGNVGVTAALEVVRTLRASGTRLAQDLLVVDFFNEEPNRFGISCVGSRALTGTLSAAHLNAQDAAGTRFGDALLEARIDPSQVGRAVKDFTGVIAFVELHIEQGPHLEEQGNRIGLVTSITGISRFRGIFHGRRDHAGTTPMNRRHDAGCAAAGTVLAVESIASDRQTSRGTTGSVTFTPDAVNVVSERAEVRGEFRSPDAQWLTQAREKLLTAASQHGEQRDVTLELEWLPGEEPVAMSDPLLNTASRVVSDMGLSHTRMYSGAEHDASQMARQVPTAMIFVPSRDGRSHCPEEFTETADILAGAEVLLNTIIRISTQHSSM
ncbi:Zn-dependent hydrolase [Nesterenkonia haasae]|uniref:Zn-dependent hydrolase n=1 Tax=Nesterenkonia haasae TaxID=2587813 RepID=UPI0013910A0A|nr:Zn-dependent hydrolase [Nesterenkonia haasae]NDK32046.1 Zn-dependent hydrolase [Nesterenkonia haasae]